MEVNMDRETLIKKYGDIQMEFAEYYKYSFTYCSKDNKIVITVGGDPDDIYRLFLEKSMTLGELLQSTEDYEIERFEIDNNKEATI